MCEILRKSTIAPLGVLHANTEDIEFGEFFFPRRTVFVYNLYHVQNDPEYWDDPYELKPERFLTPDGKPKKHERFIPFMIGKRSCPGEALAYTEFFLFFSGLMQQFKFSLDPSKPVPDISPYPAFIMPPPKHELLIEDRLTD